MGEPVTLGDSERGAGVEMRDRSASRNRKGDRSRKERMMEVRGHNDADTHAKDNVYRGGAGGASEAAQKAALDSKKKREASSSTTATATSTRQTAKAPELRIWEYRFGHKIGEGAFGEIFLGTNVETSQHVAIKLEDRAGRKRHTIPHETVMYGKVRNGAGIPKLHRAGWII